MLDYIRQGTPCGYGDTSTPDGLTACTTDADCDGTSHPNLGTGGFVCGCAGASNVQGSGSSLTCSSGQCPNASGRCILSACRDQVAEYRVQSCAGSTDPGCVTEISPCDSSSEICQIIACVDQNLQALTDNRIQMTGQ
jgi:hypothetical protein